MPILVLLALMCWLSFIFINIALETLSDPDVGRRAVLLLIVHVLNMAINSANLISRL